jgi:hypothetical protein
MNITKHAKQRYVERVMNISGKQQVATTMTVSSDKINKEIENLFIESRLVFDGQVGGDKANKQFYLHKDNELVFVLDSSFDNLVTIYRINFAFPKHVRDYVIEELIKTIDDFTLTIDNSREEIKTHLGEIDTEIQRENDLIKHYQSLIDASKNNISILQQTRENTLNRSSSLFTERQIYINQLLSNNEWKTDFKLEA